MELNKDVFKMFLNSGLVIVDLSINECMHGLSISTQLKMRKSKITFLIADLEAERYRLIERTMDIKELSILRNSQGFKTSYGYIPQYCLELLLLYQTLESQLL